MENALRTLEEVPLKGLNLRLEKVEMEFTIILACLNNIHNRYLHYLSTS